MNVLWALPALNPYPQSSGAGGGTDVVPVLALCVSGVAFLFSLALWLERRRQDKRDMFLRIHDALVEPDLQRGRRLLFARTWTVADVDDCFRTRPEEWDLINGAMAMFDVFALYAEMGYVKEDLVIREWGHIIYRVATRGQPVIDFRAKKDNLRPWPHLRRIAPKAMAWADEHPQP